MLKNFPAKVLYRKEWVDSKNVPWLGKFTYFDKLYFEVKKDNGSVETLEFDVDTHNIIHTGEDNLIKVKTEKKPYYCLQWNQEYLQTETSRYTEINVNNLFRVKIYSDISTDDRSCVIVDQIKMNHQDLVGSLVSEKQSIPLKNLKA